jgi:hypothetical protein
MDEDEAAPMDDDETEPTPDSDAAPTTSPDPAGDATKNALSVIGGIFVFLACLSLAALVYVLVEFHNASGEGDKLLNTVIAISIISGALSTVAVGCVLLGLSHLITLGQLILQHLRLIRDPNWETGQ